MKFEKGQHGPVPVTGRFSSREELELTIGELLESGVSQNKIASSCDVACATVNNIVKKLREVELGRLADLKNIVLYGKWADIPEIMEDEEYGVVTDSGGVVVGAGRVDGVRVPCGAGCLADACEVCGRGSRPEWVTRSAQGAQQH